MPIYCSASLSPVDQEAFHALDKKVMKHAFAIHNELGRFFAEDIYQAELARRCVLEGLCAQREVMVCIEYSTFRKEYYLDLLLSSGSICELKCVAGLVNRHDSQVINYLLLTGLQYGKLINFRPESVEARFVSTGLSYEARQRFHVDDSKWQGGGKMSTLLYLALHNLLADLGAFLSVDLYRDALIHLVGGETRVVRPVDVISGGEIVGQKKMCLLDEETAFHLSAMSKRMPEYEMHLQRLLAHTTLRTMPWVNFDQGRIGLKTLRARTE